MLNFAQPAWLFALLLLPLFGLINWQQIQKERQALEAFARETALAKMDLRPNFNARLIRGGMLLLALALGLIALAQPRWGVTGEEAMRSQDGNLVVALDVSKSMLTRDVGGASRLDAAKQMLNEMLPHLAGWRVGVVGFAGEGQALVPLTTDASAVETLLQRAQPGVVQGAGSNLEAGLRAAEPLFVHPGRQIILLLTDGEELQGNARSVTAELRKHGIQVIALGLGSNEGGYVPGPPDLWGNPTFLTYHGDKVVSKLHEDSLRSLANDTQGAYYHAAETLPVAEVQAKLGHPEASASQGNQKPVSQGFELFQLPLGLALALLVVETVWGLLGRPRPEQRFADQLRYQLGGESPAEGSPLLRTLRKLKRPAVGALLLAISFSQTAWTWFPTWLPNSEAGKAYQSGDYDRAGKLLEGAIKIDPENFRLLYNRGNIEYQQKHYQQAINTYGRAWELAPEAERPTIGYNMGNALFRYAEESGDLKGYERAITEYERVLTDRPDDADAKHNLEVARERLKQAKKSRQSGGNGGQAQGSGNGNAQMPVGVNQTYKPMPVKNLPSESEVDALLKALESDERQRQAEQGDAEQQANQGTSTGAPPQNLLQQALGNLDLQKDW